MDTVKDAVIQMIHDMPKTVSVNDIMAELYFREKVDAGLQALDDGQGIEHQEAKDRVKKWLE
ncbi:MAG: hypothetical protein K0A90_07995 [Methanosarcinaceae archaeon]|nr:hypothetical protein [Methanosarcinaceae archaeon]